MMRDILYHQDQPLWNEWYASYQLWEALYNVFERHQDPKVAEDMCGAAQRLWDIRARTNRLYPRSSVEKTARAAIAGIKTFGILQTTPFLVDRLFFLPVSTLFEDAKTGLSEVWSKACDALSPVEKEALFATRGAMASALLTEGQKILNDAPEVGSLRDRLFEIT
jgi:hypothetical protein